MPAMRSCSRNALLTSLNSLRVPRPYGQADKLCRPPAPSPESSFFTAPCSKPHASFIAIVSKLQAFFTAPRSLLHDSFMAPCSKLHTAFSPRPKTPSDCRPSRPHAPCHEPSSHACLGFTLLEVLVALAILAVSCTAVIKAVVSVQDAFVSEQTRQTAAMLGAEKMASIELSGPEDISLWQGRFEDHPDYRWSLDVSETGQEGMLTTVVLTVSHGREERRLATFERVFFSPPE